MTWHVAGYSVPTFGAAVVSGLILVFAWRHRGEPDVRNFTLLMLTLAG